MFGRSYWLKKRRAQYSTSRPYPGWSKAKEIGIVVPEQKEESRRELERLIQSWKDEGKRVHFLWISQKRVSKKDTVQRLRSTVYKNDISWKSEPIGAEFNEFAQQKYDIVLHLCTENQGVEAFVPLLLDTAFLVGPESNKDLPADLKLKIKDQSWEAFIATAEHWLKQINHGS